MPDRAASDSTAPLKSSGWRRAFAAGMGLGTLLLLAGLLGYVAGDVHVEPPPPRTVFVPQPPSRTPEAIDDDRIDTELATLEAKVAELRSLVQQFEGASSSLTVRIGKLEKRVSTQARARSDAPPAKPSPPGRAPNGADLGPMEQRLFAVEKGMQEEGRARVDFQTKVEQRLFNIEKLRDQSDAQRAKAQEALAERLYNLEARIQSLEERTLAFERKVLSALEDVGQRR